MAWASGPSGKGSRKAGRRGTQGGPAAYLPGGTAPGNGRGPGGLCIPLWAGAPGIFPGSRLAAGTDRAGEAGVGGETVSENVGNGVPKK